MQKQKKDAKRLSFDIGGIYIRDRYCLFNVILFYYFFIKIQLYYLQVFFLFLYFLQRDNNSAPYPNIFSIQQLF